MLKTVSYYVNIFSYHYLPLSSLTQITLKLRNTLHASTSAMEVPMDVLGTPLEYRVEREYLGPDSKHVVAHGDYVVVCAWIQNHTTALAYSENNSSIGKIPASCLDLQDSRPAVIDGVYLALANQNVSSESFWDIGWVAGSHIKMINLPVARVVKERNRVKPSYGQSWYIPR